MNDAMYIAATGMKAQGTQLEVIANNVANVNTPGFKRTSMRFGDLVSTTAVQGADQSSLSSMAGVALGSAQRSFAAGELRQVADRMSVAIDGIGFLEVQLPDGSSAYSRGGSLTVNPDGLLSTPDGHALRQHIQVSADVRQLTIGEDGAIQALDDAGRTSSLGRIELAVFARPSELNPLGDGLWQASARSGDAQLLPPAEAGAGRIKQGYQEASNVALVDEMIQLMAAQRAYEMNVKVMQAADEVAGMTNNLRK